MCRANCLSLTYLFISETYSVLLAAGNKQHKASTTSGLDLCPTASPEFTGPRNEMLCLLTVNTLKSHPFHIYHLFLNVK